jgi:hypothetical protein
MTAISAEVMRVLDGYVPLPTWRSRARDADGTTSRQYPDAAGAWLRSNSGTANFSRSRINR